MRVLAIKLANPIRRRGFYAQANQRQRTFRGLFVFAVSFLLALGFLPLGRGLLDQLLHDAGQVSRECGAVVVLLRDLGCLLLIGKHNVFVYKGSHRLQADRFGFAFASGDAQDGDLLRQSLPCNQGGGNRRPGLHDPETHHRVVVRLNVAFMLMTPDDKVQECG